MRKSFPGAMTDNRQQVQVIPDRFNPLTYVNWNSNVYKYFEIFNSISFECKVLNLIEIPLNFINS